MSEVTKPEPRPPEGRGSLSENKTLQQRVVISKFKTSEDAAGPERKLNELLAQGWTVIPHTQSIVTDQFAWTTIMVFLQREGEIKPEKEKKGKKDGVGDKR